MDVDLASLDLGQIENVVDEREQMLGGAQNSVKRLEVVFALQIDRIFAQHFGHADNCVERRTQLVRHIGQELRLQLAGNL